MVVIGFDIALVEEVIDKLEEKFALHQLGDLSFFLGIHIKSNIHGLFLNQTQYLITC